MALPTVGIMSASAINTEFGIAPSFGAYRVNENHAGLTYPLDTGIPTSGAIKFSDFYGKKRNHVIKIFDFNYTDDEGDVVPHPDNGSETRIDVRADKWSDDRTVRVIGGFAGKRESGSKIYVTVAKSVGSQKGKLTDCAIITGTWGTSDLIIDLVGANGVVSGAGGDGGKGADGITYAAQLGGNGSSGIGIQHSGTVVNVRSGSRLQNGYAGGTGGSGGRETSKRDRRAGGGGGGGGAGFPFGNGGSGGEPQAGTRDNPSDIGKTGGNGTLTTGGPGGGGGDNEDQAGGGTGGVGAQFNVLAGTGGLGARANNGFAVLSNPGVSFTVNNISGTVHGDLLTLSGDARVT